jgi:hypothetical protein
MRLRIPLSVLVICIVATGLVYADTLTLQSGQVIYGVFQGRNSEGVQFLGPDGHVKLYPFSEVQNLTFGPVPQAQAPVPAAQAPQIVQVPAGTVLIVRMNETLDTSNAQTGQTFAASMATNLAADGYVVAPAGTALYGQIVEANSAKRGSGKSQLKIQLTQIVINGNPVPIITSVFDTEGKSSTKRSFRRLLGGAGLGAAIGGIAGNAGMGAAIGAVSGAALAVVQKGDQVQIPVEGQVSFTLQQPVQLPAIQ